MRPVSALALVFVLALASLADAQSRRPVRRGDVTGVELGLEGPLSVTRGGTLRWFVTAYEVVGLDGLRPAPGAEIAIATALEEQETITVTMNEAGQGLLEIPVPEDAPNSFGVTLTLNARRGVTRRFDLRVATTEYRLLELHGSPVMHAGTRLPVGGRLGRQGGAALPGQPITLTISDSRGPLGAPVVVETDVAGVFSAQLPVRRDAEGGVQVQAKTAADEDGRRVQSSISVALLTEQQPRLILQARALEPIVRPGNAARFEVIARRPDGRPVPGAIVSFNDMPVVSRIMEIPEDREDRYATTDGRGRAILTLDPRRTRGVSVSHRDLSIAMHAGAEGIGQASVSAPIRVSSYGQAATLRVEGGALAPGMTVRVHALVASMDGSPAQNQRVRITGPAIGEHEGQTDASGRLIVPIRYNEANNDDGCGGSAATKVRLAADDAHPVELCLAVDIDQTTRPDIVEIGQESITVRVQRRRDVARTPVVVTLHRVGSTSDPVAAIRVLGNQDTAELAMPDGPRSDFLVRTRALIGREERPVRGALVRVPMPVDAPIAPRASGQVTGITVGTAHDVARTTLLLALPAENAADRHAGQVHPSFAPFLRIGTAPRDDGAPYVKRDGRVVAAPMPASSGAILRDPWRASERFVSGRLGLVFRALEARVNAAVPGRIADVATEVRGRLQLNDELIASLDASSLGGEGATGLGGEAITIAQIKGLDRGFGYDAIARRITRQRLFGLLLGLRDFVRERGFDLPWARPGDPTLWLRPLQGRHVAGFGSITPRALADGWGRPFRLMRVTRPRYAQVQPVVGYEVVSAGPDGRFGTGDDLRDPTARVLPSGSLYANAVGEDDLVARLGGVELGRTSAQSLAGAFGVGVRPPPVVRAQNGTVSALPNLPPVLADQRFALELQRPAQRFAVPFARVHGTGDQSATLSTGEEPRTWRVVARSYGADGRRSEESVVVRAGSNVLTTAELPSRLRVDEPFRTRVEVTNVGRETATFTVDSQGSGISIQLPASIEVPTGETRAFDATLQASEPGREIAVVRVSSGEDRRTLRRRVAIDRGLHPIRRVATGVAPFRTTLDVPRRAVAPQTRVVVVGATGLGLDPDLGDTRRAEPALIAWSRTLAGAEIEAELRAQLLRANNQSALSHAAAVVALSSLFTDEGEPDAAAAAQRARLASSLGGLAILPDRDNPAGRLRSRALAVAALATSGVPSGSEGSDPVSSVLRGWRRELRQALRDMPGEPSLMARASASLLLMDPRDGHGRAMYERAIEAIVEDGGFHTLPGTQERPGRIEEVSATLSLAIAAHQMGDGERARQLLRGAAQHVSAITRAPSEATFWWLAAGAYGVFGDAPEAVQLEVNGSSRGVELENGVGVLTLDTGSGGRARVRHLDANGSTVMIRAESVFGRPFESSEGELLSLSLAGETGPVDGQAGLELEIKANAAVSQPIVELQLPAGIEADEALLALLTRSSAVTLAERRNPGFVRLHLSAMADETERTIALPVPWRSRSTVRGLGVVAYPAGMPQLMTVLAPRDLAPSE